MQLFYTDKLEGQWAWLSADESRHALRVLRKKTGDTLDLMDGQGAFYTGIIEAIEGKECRVLVQERHDQPKSSPHIHLVVAPTKQNDRLEWLLEKATEIGVSEISLFFSEHSERRKYRVDRGERVILAAAKQSLRAWLPRLHPPLVFQELLRDPRWESYSARGIATCVEVENKRPLFDWLHQTSPQQIALLIGPEGDFSAEELEMAIDAGFQPLSLGGNRLRTETAGLVAVHTVQLLADFSG